MTATPSDPQSAGNERDPLDAESSAITLTAEDKLQLFWRRNRTLIIVVCIAVTVAIIGIGVFDYLEGEREKDVQEAYVTATTPETLKVFADAHSEHALGGAAYLRLADDAFSAGKFADALTNYDKAAKTFKEGPLAARTKLGLAVTKVVSGKATEGTAELKQLVDDANQFKGIRAEAAYHLASLAAESSNVPDVQKYSDLLIQIDPASLWTQRAMMLRATLPPSPPAADATTAPSGAPAMPAIEFKVPGK
ncbi:MAG: tetratricopeptide repeat protein [Opitutaceae bacterium]